ncbi:DRTGG domain-containing protein [Natronincola peptidivorans]|uniref:DRTGG domain-containing protein n=1 Tax=Natronincola peptidivorans TaxID=426128 RepID=A0A1H9Z205_9FIRM|nr:DRTGG domain-containing protein [Natronincola peptidivorans]SES75388.1 DRTGG domain-containing protein [Natronincola peptidivorans]
MITVEELKNKLSLEVIGGEGSLSNVIKNVYIGDLLSWVMAHMKHQDAWITIQTNTNVIAVAALGEAACVIIAENAEIEDVTINKANEEGIPLLRSNLSAYELAIELNHYIKDK